VSIAGLDSFFSTLKTVSSFAGGFKLLFKHEFFATVSLQEKIFAKQTVVKNSLADGSL